MNRGSRRCLVRSTSRLRRQVCGAVLLLSIAASACGPRRLSIVEHPIAGGSVRIESIDHDAAVGLLSVRISWVSPSGEIELVDWDWGGSDRRHRPVLVATQPVSFSFAGRCYERLPPDAPTWVLGDQPGPKLWRACADALRDPPQEPGSENRVSADESMTKRPPS